MNRRLIAALGQTLLPAGGVLYAGASDTGVADRIDDALVRFPPLQRRAMAALCTWLEIAPLTVVGFRRRFSGLDPASRLRFIEWVAVSKRRDLKVALFYLRQLIFVFYAASPEVEQHVGYDYRCRRDGKIHGRAG